MEARIAMARFTAENLFVVLPEDAYHHTLCELLSVGIAVNFGHSPRDPCASYQRGAVGGQI